MLPEFLFEETIDPIGGFLTDAAFQRKCLGKMDDLPKEEVPYVSGEIRK